MSNHDSVVFNGDGYTDDWKIEAESRGLPNLQTTLDALPALVTDEAMELFSRYGVFSPREMHSRFEIALEQYAMSIGVEARLTLEMATTIVVPAALRYQTELATNLASLQAVGIDGDRVALDEVTAALADLRAGIATLRAGLAPDGPDTTEKQAEHAGKTLLPAMLAVRGAADELETLVADYLWPLATYQEMLFML